MSLRVQNKKLPTGEAVGSVGAESRIAGFLVKYFPFGKCEIILTDCEILLPSVAM